MTRNTCSFFGHRKIEVSEELELKVKMVIEDLILNHNVTTFLFGSKSEFNYLCLEIVTNLKNKYNFIKRIFYTCRSEFCILEKEKSKYEELYSYHLKRDVKLFGFEEEFEHKTKYTSGRASYVERNQTMIDDCNYCIFYYNESYQPEMRKYAKRYLGYYQPKSGTRIAYNYAKQKKKTIINVFN